LPALDGTRDYGDMAGLPLSTLLSQVLVAFTIEFDNEFEHCSPHRTTRASAGASPGGPWLVSLVMWANLMRLVGEEGVRVGELQDQGGNLAGMERWGYVVVEPDAADARPRPPRRDWVVRPTAKGRAAQAVWPPLFGVIEQRWQGRFGQEQIGKLRESLQVLVARLDVQLPDYLPVLGYGLWATAPAHPGRAAALPDGGVATSLNLPALVSKVLLAFTLDFERASRVSLAISANVLRVLGQQAARVRDLPHLTGVSKEAIAMSLGFLEKRGYVVLQPDPTGSRSKSVQLTPQGRQAHDAYCQSLDEIEARWQTRFGADALCNLRRSLEYLVGEAGAQRSPLFDGLRPYPDGWRASVRAPDTLPHYPMVLHRGGFPDGS
jgi:DNA-binding MarR family transcriptional regulator